MNQYSAPRRPRRLTLPLSRWPLGTVLLRTRYGVDQTEDIFPLRQADLRRFEEVEPWRISGFRRGQTNKAGWYWSVTNQGLTPFESGGELDFLIKADMADDARRFLSQPFQMIANERGGRSYVPDFLIVGQDLSIRVVEVKPRYRLKDESIALTVDWARGVVEGHGWAYEVHTEIAPQEAENRMFLATYRRAWQFDPVLLQQISTESEAAEFFGGLEARISGASGVEAGVVRAHILHLCWTKEFTLNLQLPIDPGTILTLGSRQAPASSDMKAPTPEQDRRQH